MPAPGAPSSKSVKNSFDEQSIIFRPCHPRALHARAERQEKTWNPSARVRARESREFSRVIGWLTFSAVKFRPCHANANCSRLGRGHECACGPIPSRSKILPHSAMGGLR
jgi:hypothetical protein